MADSHPSFATLALKTIVVHSVTYFVCGVLAFYGLDYAHKFAEPGVREVMRQTSEPIVMAGPLFQPIRGLLFAIAFYPIRSAIFGRKHGWLAMWLLLLILGILNTFGPSSGSIEGMVYTTIPILSSHRSSGCPRSSHNRCCSRSSSVTGSTIPTSAGSIGCWA